MAGDFAASPDGFDPIEALERMLKATERDPFVALIAVRHFSRRFNGWAGLRSLLWERNRRPSPPPASWRERFAAWWKTLADRFMCAPFPAQVLNEFRNALTHLSRVAHCADHQAVKAEFDAAQRHLERATRDAYKILIISKRDQLKRLERVVYARSRSLPITICKQITNIEREWRDISIAEHMSPAGTRHYASLIDRYKELFETLRWLETHIKTEYSVKRLSIMIWGAPAWLRHLSYIVIMIVLMFSSCLSQDKYACRVVTWLDRLATRASIGSVMSEHCAHEGFAPHSAPHITE